MRPSYDIGGGAADLSRPFIPDRTTPLFYTPEYAKLAPAQRLRYNQLHALYTNEQFMFFEDALAGRVLTAVLKEDLPAELAASLRLFIAEEGKHSEMFRRLNRLCAPELYADSDYHFVRVPVFAQKILDWASARPRLFPFFLWIMLLQEERSVYISREIAREGAGIEPHFATAHRLHMADEVGHVGHDETLIRLLWGTRPRLVRAANARMLAAMVREFFYFPKRACLLVVDRLAREFPELEKSLPAIKSALRGVENSRSYHISIYSRASVPKAFALMDAWPDLSSLGSVMKGYTPPPVVQRRPAGVA